MRDRRLVGTSLLLFHVGEIEAKGRDAAIGKAGRDLVHESMPHIGARAMRQHVTGTRIVRLRQNRRDRADALDVELELLCFGRQNQTSRQTPPRPPW
ncbi:hypothetical protein ABH988_000398 [Bradyrhizobium ottawaense]